MDELDLMRDYASVFGKGNNYHYYIFSKGGFTDGLLQAQERGEVQLNAGRSLQVNNASAPAGEDWQGIFMQFSGFVYQLCTLCYTLAQTTVAG